LNVNAGREDHDEKLPFYMTFPFSDHRWIEDENEADMALLKTVYPPEARRLWPIVEELCDRLEYDGSIMFDEYPDIGLIRRHISAAMKENAGQMPSEAAPGGREQNRDLAEILLLQEMYMRRERRRRFRRHYIY